MKKSIYIAAIVLLSLSAAAQTDPIVANYFQWEQESMAKAKTGEMKWSVFFSDAFDRASNLPSHPMKTFKLQLYAESIPLARRYESGKISQEQFQDEGRLIFTRAQAEAEPKLQALQAQEHAFQEQQRANQAQRDQQERTLQQARREQANQQVMQGMTLLQAARPKPIAPLFNPSVSCTTRQYGGALQTNCN